METDAGYGRVHNTLFIGGNLEALFANATLERVNQNCIMASKVQLSIPDPESSAPRLMLMARLCPSEEIPGATKGHGRTEGCHAEKTC